MYSENKIIPDFDIGKMALFHFFVLPYWTIFELVCSKKTETSLVIDSHLTLWGVVTLLSLYI
jgi:hypothetical protein